nr:CD225/dispanin family protein [Clostridia bacterium]
MVCKACGHINQDNMAKFCSACGSELQQDTQNNVYQQNVTPQPPPQYVPNYLIFSILTAIFCCLPIGIAAIIKSSQVDKKIALGLYDEAITASRQAKT